jgi:hypothetical protein
VPPRTVVAALATFASRSVIDVGAARVRLRAPQNAPAPVGSTELVASMVRRDEHAVGTRRLA